MTPVSRGVVRPLLITSGLVTTVSVGAHYWSFIAHHAPLIALIAAGPSALVTMTRWWQWRSHKIVVTTQRVFVSGGLLARSESQYDIRDVIAARVERRLHERLSRRGAVFLETQQGTVFLGVVRHPAALARLIEAQRHHVERSDTPLDTVFSYEPDEIIPPVFKRVSRRTDAPES